MIWLARDSVGWRVMILCRVVTPLFDIFPSLLSFQTLICIKGAKRLREQQIVCDNLCVFIHCIDIIRQKTCFTMQRQEGEHLRMLRMSTVEQWMQSVGKLAVSCCITLRNKILKFKFHSFANGKFATFNYRLSLDFYKSSNDSLAYMIVIPKS